MSIIYIDLDHTICFPNESYGEHSDKYRFGFPNLSLIMKIRFWYREGHDIVIYTARRMLTHDNDVDMVRADVEQLTIDWLANHAVPYDELKFGKPYYDVLIDDKTCLPDEESLENAILQKRIPGYNCV